MSTQNIIKKVSALCSIIVIFGTLSAPSIIVSAQTTGQYTLLEPLPCVPGTGNNCTLGEVTKEVNIQTYIVYIFKLMIAVAVFATVVMVIIGGFQYMLTDSVTKKGDARSTIKNAFLGLAGALLSYLILYTINPQLVDISLVTVPKLNLTVQPISTSDPAAVAALAAQAAELTNETRALQAKVATDNAAVATAYNDLINSKCLESNGSQNENSLTPDCQGAIQKWQNLQDTATASINKEAFAHATNDFAANALLEREKLATQYNGIETPELIQSSLNANTAVYNADMATLKANNDVADQAALTAAYNAAQAPFLKKQADMAAAAAADKAAAQKNANKTGTNQQHGSYLPGQ